MATKTAQTIAEEQARTEQRARLTQLIERIERLERAVTTLLEKVDLVLAQTEQKAGVRAARKDG